MALTDNLISYYPLHTNSNDSAGANNGSDTDVSYDGSEATFNGSTSFVNLGSPSNLNLGSNNAFSLIGWVYQTVALNGCGYVSEMYTPSAQTVMYEIGSGMANPSNKLQVGFYDGNWHYAQDSVDMTLNAWVFVVGTWDGTTLILYKNGVQVGTSTPGVPTPSGFYDGAVIGKRHDTFGQPFFQGNLKEVGIWSRGLSQSEVTTLYNNGTPLSYPFVTGNKGGFFAIL